MKKFSLLIVFGIISLSLSAQLKVGAGFTFTPEIGVTVKAQKNITENIDGDVQLTYYFIEDITVFGFETSTNLLSLDLNGHYNFDIDSDFEPYALAGLGIGFVSVKTKGGPFGDTDVSDTDIGLNLGGGATYSFGSFDLWAEAQLTVGGLDDFFLRAGILFPVGN